MNDVTTPETIDVIRWSFTASPDRAGEIVPQSGAEQAMTIMQRLQGQ